MGVTLINTFSNSTFKILEVSKGRIYYENTASKEIHNKSRADVHKCLLQMHYTLAPNCTVYYENRPCTCELVNSGYDRFVAVTDSLITYSKILTYYQIDEFFENIQNGIYTLHPITNAIEFTIVHTHDSLRHASPDHIYTIKKTQKCNHTNKYINYAGGQGFWYCPDCRADLGNV